jgi:hypothetical protein
VVDCCRLPRRRNRAHLHTAGVLLAVQVDPEWELIGKPAVERQPAPVVRAEEIHLAGGVYACHGQPAEYQHHSRGPDQPPPPATAAGGEGSGGGPAGRPFGGAACRRAHARRGQPLLLRRGADQRLALVDLRRTHLLEPEGNHGDVVAASCLVCLAHELRRSGFEARCVGEQGRDPLLRKHRRKPVATEQKDVAGPGGVSHRVHLDLGLWAQRPRDDRALGVLLGLLLGQSALAAKLLHQRVVTGQTAQRAVPKHVRAAIADVGDADLVALDKRRRERRAHTRAGGVLLGEVVDPGVGELRNPPQVDLGRLAASIAGLEGLRRDSRRDLSSLRAAHAVRDREHRRASEIGVLVRTALAARVRAMGALGYSQHWGKLDDWLGVIRLDDGESGDGTVSGGRRART